jgi:hypothetical protein
MQRDLSYALDSTLAGRNQGQLVSQQVVQTRMSRVPGLQPLAAGAPRPMLGPANPAAAVSGLGFLDPNKIDGKWLMAGIGLVALIWVIGMSGGKKKR